MVGDDRHRSVGDPRRRTIERVPDATANGMRGVTAEPKSGPEGASRTDLGADAFARVARQSSHLRDCVGETATERERGHKQPALAGAQLDGSGHEERDGRSKGRVFDPQRGAVASLSRRDGWMRQRPTLGDLGVVGPTEPRVPAPLRHEAQWRASYDADDLDRAGAASRGHGRDLDPCLVAIVDREGK